MSGIDQNMLMLIGLGGVFFLLAILIIMFLVRGRNQNADQAETTLFYQEQIYKIIQANNELEARIKVMGENHALAQEEVKRTMNDRLDKVSVRLGESLEKSSEKTGESLEKLKERSGCD